MARAVSDSRPSLSLQWLASAAMICLTVVIAVLVVRSAKQRLNVAPEVILQAQSAPFWPGVSAKISSNGVTIKHEFATLDFQLALGQLLDDRMSDSALEVEFTVRFMPRQATAARIGAILRGGSVIIMRDGRVLHSNFVGDEEGTVLSTVPESYSRAPQELTYIFKTDGKSPVRLQAVWQPIGTDQPQPLPMPAK